MERLQKKCLVGSLVSHGVLVVVLAVATAFGSKTFKPVNELQSKQDNYIPIKLMDVDALTDGESRQGGGGGGGSPAAAPAQPSPAPAVQPPPAAAPQPPIVQPPPKAETVKLPEPEPEPVVIPPKAMEAVVIPKQSLRPEPKKKAEKTEPKKEAKAETPAKKEAPKAEPKKVDVNLKTVDRSKTDAANRQKAAAAAAAAAERAQQAADAKAIRDARARQAAIRDAFDGLNKGISQSGGSLDIASFGVGSGKGWGVGSGPTLMNYSQYVREIYDLNWIVTDNVVGDAGIVRVEIVVQRNGAARGKIIKGSGNAMLDRSVQNALDKVKNIGKPFPEGATDSSRTFIINFNLTSKRGTG